MPAQTRGMAGGRPLSLATATFRPRQSVHTTTNGTFDQAMLRDTIPSEAGHPCSHLSLPTHKEDQPCASLLDAVRQAAVAAQEGSHQARRDKLHGIMPEVRRQALAQLQAVVQQLVNHLQSGRSGGEQEAGMRTSCRVLHFTPCISTCLHAWEPPPTPQQPRLLTPHMPCSCVYTSRRPLARSAAS